MTEEQDSRALRRWFAIGSVVVVLWAIWLILRPLRMPIAWAAMLAFLMAPLQSRLTRRFGGRPTVAAGVLTALTPIAIFAPLTLIGIAFAEQISGLAATLQQNPELFNLAAWMDEQKNPRIAGMFSWIASRTNLDLVQIQGYIRDSLQEWAGALAGVSGKLFLNAAGMILSFVVMLFILFFVLRDGVAWFARLAALLPLTEEHRSALLLRLGKVTRAVVYGCGLTAALQGLLVGIGFAVAGLPGPVVFGVTAAIAGLLPFGGSALVWGPAVLYLIGTGHFGWGVFMLVWGGFVSISDNIFRPVIVSRYTPVPTLLVFLGVIGGVAAFGMIGFIVGPVILVLATEMLRFAEGSLTRRD